MRARVRRNKPRAALLVLALLPPAAAAAGSPAIEDEASSAPATERARLPAGGRLGPVFTSRDHWLEGIGLDALAWTDPARPVLPLRAAGPEPHFGDWQRALDSGVSGVYAWKLLLAEGAYARAEDESEAGAPLSSEGDAASTEWAIPTSSFAPLLASRDGWQERAQLDSELDLGRGAGLSFETQVTDLRRRLTERGGRFDLDSLRRYERNTAGSSAVRLSLLDGRLHFGTRYGWSRYRRSESFADRLAAVPGMEDGGGLARYLVRDEDVAQSIQHEIDMSLWRSGPFELSAFGSVHSADSDFMARVAAAPRAREDDRGEALEYGGKLKTGPLQLTLARETTRKWIHRGERGRKADDRVLQLFDPREEPDTLGREHRRLRASATLSLYGLRERARASVGQTAALLLPGSIWMNVAEGEVEPIDGRLVEDGTRDVSFGVSWDAGASSLGLSYWSSLYDTRQPGAEESDWAGQGAYVSYGYYAGRWDVYASGGFGRYENLDPWSRSTDTSFDGSLALWLRPEGLPDVSAAASVGRYQTDYTAYALESRTDVVVLSTSLDFTKHLPGIRDDDTRKLQATYRFTGLSVEDGFTGASGRGTHALLMLVQTRF